jgi:hypothetical protein
MMVKNKRRKQSFGGQTILRRTEARFRCWILRFLEIGVLRDKAWRYVWTRLGVTRDKARRHARQGLASCVPIRVSTSALFSSFHHAERAPRVISSLTAESPTIRSFKTSLVSIQGFSPPGSCAQGRLVNEVHAHDFQHQKLHRMIYDLLNLHTYLSASSACSSLP